jgi:hypothetical protein
MEYNLIDGYRLSKREIEVIKTRFQHIMKSDPLSKAIVNRKYSLYGLIVDSGQITHDNILIALLQVITIDGLYSDIKLDRIGDTITIIIIYEYYV